MRFLYKKAFPAGFTLIELLIVVGIIAILAAIALVNMQLASDRALSAKCKSNLRAIDYALKAYRIDYNRFPPADGTAGDEPTPTETEVGNGPAANGCWSGISILIVKLGYTTDKRSLFCPVYERRYRNKLQRFRYAYNSAAYDVGGPVSGSDNLDKESGDVWYCRCLWVPADKSWYPSDNIQYPHGPDKDQENVLYSNGRVELSKGRDDYIQTYYSNN